MNAAQHAIAQARTRKSPTISQVRVVAQNANQYSIGWQ